MALLIGSRPLTAAEKQKRYRDRRHFRGQREPELAALSDGAHSIDRGQGGDDPA